MKRLGLKSFGMFLLLSLLNIHATYAGGLSDDEGYYWYHSRVSSYPTGKGLVYAQLSGDSALTEPTEEMFSEQIVLKNCTETSSSELHVYNKPFDGYNFNGWYWAENGKPAGFITKDSIIGGIFNNNFLSYTHSDDKETEYYSETPDNDILGIFGRVSYDIDIDYNMDSLFVLLQKDTIDDESRDSSMAGLFYMFTSDYIKVGMDVPDNEIGDIVTLHVDSIKSQSKSVAYDDEEMVYYVYLDSADSYRIAFRGWTDTKGNKYNSPELKVNVTEAETYTAHYEYVFNLVVDDTSVKGIIDGNFKEQTIYDMNGILNNVTNKKSDIVKGKVYIVGGKKFIWF
jgi:hypothetical protein